LAECDDEQKDVFCGKEKRINIERPCELYKVSMEGLIAKCILAAVLSLGLWYL
jgi:hypothetical protein